MRSRRARSRRASRASCMAFTSPPEQKPRPAPVMTIARMSGSSLDRRRASWRSSRKVSPRALRRSGRFRVSVAIPSFDS